MNNRGVALILCLLVITILAVLSSCLFSQSISESNMVERYISEKETLWLAEAGIAEGIRNLPNNTPAGSLKQDYNYSVVVTPLPSFYYRLDSTGTIIMPGGWPQTRSIRAYVKLNLPAPGNFEFAIETTGELVTRGRAHTIGGTEPDPPVHENATLDFAALFSISKAEMRTYATHLYDDITFGVPVNGITWVDVTPGQTLTITGGLTGDGILIIQGDTHITGSAVLNGIVYVIGELLLTGTPVINGAVLAESGAGIDTEVRGHVTVWYNEDNITTALQELNALATKNIVAWHEI